MKNKTIWAFILILQLSTSVKAQPTIDSSWYYPYSASSFRNSASETIIGNFGMSQIWDFNTSNVFTAHYFFNINFSPNGFSLSGYLGGVYSDYEFYYFKLNSTYNNYDIERYYESKTPDSLILHRTQSDYFSYSMSSIRSKKFDYVNPLLILKFPFTYQTTATDSFVCFYSSSSGIGFSTNGNIRGRRELEVDGFGDLILADGLHSNAFRIKYIDSFVDTSWSTPQNTGFSRTKIILTHSYWTTDNGILLKRYEIRKDSLVNGLVPTNPYLEAKYYGGNLLVNVDEYKIKFNDVLVYPNPVQEYGSIKTPGILIKKAKLEIYNSIAGLTQELSIVPTEVDQISFETIGLAPGYYKAVIRQDDKVWTAGFIKQ